MPPRRRPKPSCNDDTKGPPKRKAKYVSLFGSPKATVAASAKSHSMQSDSDPPSECSSPEPRRKVPDPATVPPTPTASTAQHPSTQHPTTPHPTSGRFASPQSVARAFESESYHRLPEAAAVAAVRMAQTQSSTHLPRYTDSLVAEARTLQTQSRLPPSTVARKAPRKGTTVTPATPGPSRIRKLQSKLEQAEKPERPGGDFPAPSFPFKLKTFEELKDEQVLETKARGEYLLSITLGIGSADEFDVAVAAAEARARSRNAAAVSTPTPFIQPVPQPQPPESPKEPERPEKAEEPKKPEYKYDLTSELEGIKRALGECDWNEYVSLVEKVEYGKMDCDEFAKQERRIFQTPTFSGLYRVVREMVAQQLPARELGG